MNSISVVIPAYNEGKRIGSTLEKTLNYLKNKFEDFEIIIVDDGSTDNTLDIVNSFQSSNIRILKNERNRGKGFSVRKGMLSATKDLVLFSDADMSTPIGELDKFMEHVDTKDIIIASRNLKDSDIKIKQPFIRSTLGKIFPLIVRLFIIQDITDTQCGFKLFKRDVAQKIFPKQSTDKFGFDVEILYIAKKNNYRIKEIPVVWINSENSTVDPIKDSFNMLLDTFKVKLNDMKGKYNQ